MAQEFEVNGRVFRWGFEFDADSKMPWEEWDGIGVVLSRSYAKKAPHEVLIHEDRPVYWFYDVRASMAKAKRERWGLPEAETVGLTKRQIIAAAVQKDMKYCSEWLNGSRYFVCLKVWEEGNPENVDYLGGVEYSETGDNEYLIECAREMAQEMAHGLPFLVQNYSIEVSHYHGKLSTRLHYKKGDAFEASQLYTLDELGHIVAAWKKGELLGSFGMGTMLAQNAACSFFQKGD